MSSVSSQRQSCFVVVWILFILATSNLLREIWELLKGLSSWTKHPKYLSIMTVFWVYLPRQNWKDFSFLVRFCKLTYRPFKTILIYTTYFKIYIYLFNRTIMSKYVPAIWKGREVTGKEQWASSCRRSRVSGRRPRPPSSPTPPSSPPPLAALISQSGDQSTAINQSNSIFQVDIVCYKIVVVIYWKCNFLLSVCT